jgi:hypothetical protein
LASISGSSRRRRRRSWFSRTVRKDAWAHRRRISLTLRLVGSAPIKRAVARAASGTARNNRVWNELRAGDIEVFDDQDQAGAYAAPPELTEDPATVVRLVGHFSRDEMGASPIDQKISRPALTQRYSRPSPESRVGRWPSNLLSCLALTTKTSTPVAQRASIRRSSWPGRDRSSRLAASQSMISASKRRSSAVGNRRLNLGGRLTVIRPGRLFSSRALSP